MAHVKRSYAATETVVQWVLGTKPGGRYVACGGPDPLTSNLEAAKSFLSEKAANESLFLCGPTDLRGKLRVIRVSRTTRESCEG